MIIAAAIGVYYYLLYDKNALSTQQAALIYEHTFDPCYYIPSGEFKLTPDNNLFSQELSELKAAGVVKITEKPKTGNIWQDLQNIQNNPLGSTVIVRMSSDVPKTDLCQTANHLVGVVRGLPKVENLVRFEEVHGTGPDGVPFKGYFAEGTLDFPDMSETFRKINKTTNLSKFRALYGYNPYKKRWFVKAVQVASMNGKFDDAFFAAQLGR